MDKYFAGNYTGLAFEFLGSAHIGALVVLILLNISLIRFRYSEGRTKSAIPHAWDFASPARVRGSQFGYNLFYNLMIKRVESIFRVNRVFIFWSSFVGHL